MTKNYYVEIKLGKTWILKSRYTQHKDALHHIKENSGERYPMRIVRVVGTVVFDGTKS